MTKTIKKVSAKKEGISSVLFDKVICYGIVKIVNDNNEIIYAIDEEMYDQLRRVDKILTISEPIVC